jgi:hypothetical protein
MLSGSNVPCDRSASAINRLMWASAGTQADANLRQGFHTASARSSRTRRVPIAVVEVTRINRVGIMLATCRIDRDWALRSVAVGCAIAAAVADTPLERP